MNLAQNVTDFRIELLGKTLKNNVKNQYSMVRFMNECMNAPHIGFSGQFCKCLVESVEIKHI